MPDAGPPLHQHEARARWHLELGYPIDLWALVRAYGDCRADVAVNSRDVSAAQYLKLAESNLRDALAALASRPVGDVGADRVDAERYRFIRDADKSDDLIPDLSLYALESLDQYIDSAMREFAARTAGTDTARGG